VVMIVFFVALFNHNIPFDGQTRVSYLIGEPSPYIGVWPGQGVSDLKIEDDTTYRTLAKDSLYLDLKTPVRYRSVKVWAMVRQEGDTPPEFGVRMPGGIWQYRKVALEKGQQAGGWTEYAGALDLSGADRQNDKYTLLLHFSQEGGVAEAHPIALSRFKFELMRDPLTLDRIWSKVMSVARQK